MTDIRADALSLTLDGAETAVPVRHLVGEETVSRPYRFLVTVGSTPAVADAVGLGATLVISAGGRGRRIRGIVAEVAEAQGDGLILELVPALALMPALDGATDGRSLEEAIRAALDGAPDWRNELPATVAAQPARELPPAGPDDSPLDRLGLLLTGTEAVFDFDDATGSQLVIRSRGRPGHRTTASQSSTPAADPARPEILTLSRRRRAVVGGGAGRARSATLFEGQSDVADLRPGCLLSVTAGDIATPAIDVDLLSLSHTAVALDGGAFRYINQFRGGSPGAPPVANDRLPPLAGPSLAGPSAAGPSTAAAGGSAFRAGDGTGAALATPTAAADDANQVWVKLLVPETTSTRIHSYLRMGEPDTETEKEFAIEDTTRGVYSFTHGDYVQHIVGNFHQIVSSKPLTSAGARVNPETGTYKDVLWSSKYLMERKFEDNGKMITKHSWDNDAFKVDVLRPMGDKWRESSRAIVHTDTYQIGDKESFFSGFQYDGSAALKTSASLAATLDFKAGVGVSSSIGSTISYSKSWDWKVADDNSSENVGKSKSIKASDSFEVFVSGDIEQAELISEKTFYAGMIAANLAAVTATAAGAAAGAVKIEEDSPPSGWISGITAASVSFAALAAWIVARKVSEKIAMKTAPSQLRVKKSSIELYCGKSSLVLKDSGDIELKGEDVSLFVGGDFTMASKGKAMMLSDGSAIVKGADVTLSPQTFAKNLTTDQLTCLKGALGDPSTTAKQALAEAKLNMGEALSKANMTANSVRETLNKKLPVGYPSI